MTDRQYPKKEWSFQRSCGHWTHLKLTWDEYQAQVDTLQATQCYRCESGKTFETDVVLPPFEFGDEGDRQEKIDRDLDRDAARSSPWRLPGD